MKKCRIVENPKVDQVFSTYPDGVRERMQFLRQLVVTTAQEIDGLDVLETTLKWGEPSFVTKKGSTLRMDWKQRMPNQYAMYFQCTTRLVETFRMVFDRKFTFEGNRAIVFQLSETIPVIELKKCIKATLIYHDVKHLVTLGL